MAGDDEVILVKFHGWTCSLGVFPVTIKNKDFLKFAKNAKVKKEAMEIRKRVIFK